MKKRLKKMWIPGLLIIVIAAGILMSPMRDTLSGRVVYASASEMRLSLIIDAGHGGEDGGAISLSGLKESEINLEIAQKLDQIMGFFGVRTIMTRTSEILSYSKSAHTIRQKKVEDQKKRLQLINQTENAVLISIHQNKFPDGGPFGAQVLFSPTNGSKDFAITMQNSFVSMLNPRNRRVASEVPDNIFLMNHIQCPAVLIECGFLSNREEERLLSTDGYRLKIATVIASCYLNNQSTLHQIYAGGTNEG